jgi:hypothetical protein
LFYCVYFGNYIGQYWPYKDLLFILKFIEIDISHLVCARPQHSALPPITPEKTFSACMSVIPTVKFVKKAVLDFASFTVQGMMMMTKNLSCDWSIQFMKVILLGISLVKSSLQCIGVQLKQKYV